MALKDIFKKGKKDQKKQKAKSKKKRENFENFAYRILKSPYITEKALRMSEDNKYVFKVFKKANKIEIRKAVEGLYGVKVEDVKILKMPRKRRRIGKVSGYRKGFKKAIVKVKEGQKIEELIH
jgi:large subunit ribosomal protein L23